MRHNAWESTVMQGGGSGRLRMCVCLHMPPFQTLFLSHFFFLIIWKVVHICCLCACVLWVYIRHKYSHANTRIHTHTCVHLFKNTCATHNYFMTIIIHVHHLIWIRNAKVLVADVIAFNALQQVFIFTCITSMYITWTFGGGGGSVPWVGLHYTASFV